MSRIGSWKKSFGEKSLRGKIWPKRSPFTAVCTLFRSIKSHFQTRFFQIARLKTGSGVTQSNAKWWKSRWCKIFVASQIYTPRDFAPSKKSSEMIRCHLDSKNSVWKTSWRWFLATVRGTTKSSWLQYYMRCNSSEKLAASLKIASLLAGSLLIGYRSKNMLYFSCYRRLNFRVSTIWSQKSWKE